jgi:LmbE family N-acetylglucosaminyl deacetylase
MAKTLLAIGAHYDDCVYGIGGLLLQAARKHYRVVVLSLIGDYSNWAPTRGREEAFVKGVVELSKEYGAEMRFLKYASHRFDADLASKKAVAEVVAEVKPDVGFLMWFRDRHHDHEVAATLGKVALQHGDRLLDKGVPFQAAKAVYAYDNGPRHTIGFEPDTFVDVTAEWDVAAEWLGKLMALTRDRKYDPATPDAAVRAKEALAAYRGQTCGVRYAEALWALSPSPRDIL